MGKRVRRNDPSQFIDLTLDEFVKRFEPEQDPYQGIDYSSNDPLIDIRSEQHRLWTVVQADAGNEWIICPGFRLVNRIYYVTTKKPWPHLEVQVSMDTILDPEETGYILLKKVGAKGWRVLELARPHLDAVEKVRKWAYRRKGREGVEVLDDADLGYNICDTLEEMIKAGDFTKPYASEAKVLIERIYTALQL